MSKITIQKIDCALITSFFKTIQGIFKKTVIFLLLPNHVLTFKELQLFLSAFAFYTTDDVLLNCFVSDVPQHVMHEIVYFCFMWNLRSWFRFVHLSFQRTTSSSCLVNLVFHQESLSFTVLIVGVNLSLFSEQSFNLFIFSSLQILLLPSWSVLKWLCFLHVINYSFTMVIEHCSIISNRVLFCYF